MVSLININISIQYYSFISTKFNWGFFWGGLQSISNNSIKLQSFAYTVLSLTIRFNVNHSFAHGLNFKQSYLTIRCYHSRIKYTGEQWQERITLHSPKLQGWRLTIGWFNVILRTLIGWGRCSRCKLQSQPAEPADIYIYDFIWRWKCNTSICIEHCLG